MSAFDPFRPQAPKADIRRVHRPNLRQGSGTIRRGERCHQVTVKRQGRINDQRYVPGAGETVPYPDRRRWSCQADGPHDALQQLELPDR